MSKSYFSEKEQSCNCCNQGKLNGDTLIRLNFARLDAGVPFVVNCACRCEKHNRDVGGVENSAHKIKPDNTANAVDIKCESSSLRFILVRSLLRAGFKRIGVYSTFIHADDDPSLPEEVMWKA